MIVESAEAYLAIKDTADTFSEACKPQAVWPTPRPSRTNANRDIAMLWQSARREQFKRGKHGKQ